MQGKTISGYTLQRLLGVGGMAEVWYAENKIGKNAAVKMLLPKLCQDENVVSRFLTEAKVMVELNHPNIRQVYDYGDIDGRPAIVMEYLDGTDLKAKLKRGQRFTDEELKRWWNQLVSALNYTHQQGVVHRDIKPGNTFVDKMGNIKLLDFGIAKVRDSISKTQTGQKLGTLMYMSPEQVKDSKHIDYRTDVYSLAVTFVHLITGKKPYDSDTSSDFEISEQIVYKPLDMSGLPVMWRNFLTPYLEKKPEDRPALRPFEAVVSDDGTDAEGTIVGDVPEKPEPPKRKPKKPESKPATKPKTKPKPKPESNNPKPKKGLWIGLGIAAAVFLLVLLLKPKPEPIPTDPEWVDLGLPSGTLWATCNIGASKPEDYGSYFAWGETSTKRTYNFSTYKYAEGAINKLTKYCSRSDHGNNGFTDTLTTLQAGDDPATAQWGSDWRTPSKAQWEELKNNTKCEWQKGKKGYLFTSKTNGNSVFLPAAGYRWDGELNGAGSYGYYWSRSLSADYPQGVWYLGCYSVGCYMSYNYRDDGFSVRPVREK